MTAVLTEFFRNGEYPDEKWGARFGYKWGPGQPRHRTSSATWQQPLRWNKTADHLYQCGHCGWRGDASVKHGEPIHHIHCPECRLGVLKPARRRVFCASLADVFDNEVPA